MTTRSDSPAQQASDARLGRWLIGGAVLALVLAGGMLWWRQGGAVFEDMVVSALAWCF